MPLLELKRFLITDKSGNYVAAVYAEKFTPYDAYSGNFWIGEVIIGSMGLVDYDVGDSGGRMKIDPHGFTVNDA